MTTAQLGAAFPFVGGGPTGRGPLLGLDRWGTPFRFDPFAMYAAGMLTNPNVVIFGQLGRGKSGLVKTWMWRLSAGGARAWVLDPKGEYQGLASATGGAVLRLEPGGPATVNPLDIPGGGEEAELLCGAVVEAVLGRPLRIAERTALGVAVGEARRRARTQGRPATLDDVAGCLGDHGLVAGLGTMSESEWVREGRELSLAVTRLMGGEMGGLFGAGGRHQAPTDLARGSSLVALDLSALHGSPAMGLVMTCAMAWATAWIRSRPGEADRGSTYLVLDEAWAVLADLAVARWLQRMWKLSRANGVANVAVLHRVSDLAASGPAGSHQTALAEGLLHDAETRVIFGQSPAEARATGEVLGLTGPEVALVSRLPRGVALWKVAGRSTVVRHVVTASERGLIDTDERMGAGPSVGARGGVDD